MKTDVIILRSLKFTISHISTHCFLHNFTIRYILENYCITHYIYDIIWIIIKIYLSLYIYSFVLTRLQYHIQLRNRYITSNQETIRHRFCNHRLLWVNTVTMVVHTSDPSSTLFRSSDTLRETENRTATQSIFWHTTVSGWHAALTFPRPSKSIRYQIRNKSNH